MSQSKEEGELDDDALQQVSGGVVGAPPEPDFIQREPPPDPDRIQIPGTPAIRNP
jgi:hypothetical protein